MVLVLQGGNFYFNAVLYFNTSETVNGLRLVYLTLDCSGLIKKVCIVLSGTFTCTYSWSFFQIYMYESWYIVDLCEDLLSFFCTRVHVPLKSACKLPPLISFVARHHCLGSLDMHLISMVLYTEWLSIQPFNSSRWLVFFLTLWLSSSFTLLLLALHWWWFSIDNWWWILRGLTLNVT